MSHVLEMTIHFYYPTLELFSFSLKISFTQPFSLRCPPPPPPPTTNNTSYYLFPDMSSSLISCCAAFFLLLSGELTLGYGTQLWAPQTSLLIKRLDRVQQRAKPQLPSPLTRSSTPSDEITFQQNFCRTKRPAI